MPDEKTENDRYAICNAVSGRNSSDKAHAEGWVQEENGSWYYLNQAGEKARKPGSAYYVDENGVWIEGKTQAKMSGSAAVVVGGIVTVTEDIPDQAGNRSTEPGII